MSSAFPGLNEGFLARYIVYIVVAIYPPNCECAGVSFEVG